MRNHLPCDCTYFPIALIASLMLIAFSSYPAARTKYSSRIVSQHRTNRGNESYQNAVLLEEENNTKTDLARAVADVAITASSGRSFVIMTAGSFAYRDYIRNFACTLKKQGNENALLLAFDRQLLDVKLPSNIKPVRFEGFGKTPNVEQRHRFGSAGFNILSRRKMEGVVAVLETGHDVLFADTDVVWCAPNAARSMAEAAMGDVAFQHSAVWNESNKREFANTGLYYARTGPRSTSFLRAAYKGPGNHDQQATNEIACWRGGVKVYEHPRGLDGPPDYCVWNKTTIITSLEPRARYPLGCTEVGGKRLMMHNATEINAMCRDQKVALIHYACYANDQKRVHMVKQRTWLLNETTDACIPNS